MFAVIAVLNGLFRQSVLVPSLGELWGRAISSITLSSLILLATYIFLANTDLCPSAGDLFSMGAIWLVLTLAFEFGFGRLVAKRSWQVLLEDYNILKGRIWILVLATTLLGPYLVGSFVL
ncbi:MAG: hypothetical protein QXQ13_03860 [Thermoplasmata archaeon]